MQISTQNYAQSYGVNSNYSTQQTNSKNTTNSFETLLENEKNSSITKEYLIKLNFEDLKNLKLELEKNNKLYSSGLSFDSLSILEASTLTNDTDFNKSLVESMKKKEDPFLYLEETKHNMEFSEGRRKYPWPTLYVEEALDNYSALTKEEIRNINVNNFLKNLISEYEKLLSNLPYYYNKDEVEQSLKDLKEIKLDYQNKQNQLESYTKVNRLNPLTELS